MGGLVLKSIIQYNPTMTPKIQFSLSSKKRKATSPSSSTIPSSRTGASNLSQGIGDAVMAGKSDNHKRECENPTILLGQSSASAGAGDDASSQKCSSHGTKISSQNMDGAAAITATNTNTISASTTNMTNNERFMIHPQQKHAKRKKRTMMNKNVFQEDEEWNNGSSSSSSSSSGREPKLLSFQELKEASPTYKTSTDTKSIEKNENYETKMKKEVDSSHDEKDKFVGATVVGTTHSKTNHDVEMKSVDNVIVDDEDDVHNKTSTMTTNNLTFSDHTVKVKLVEKNEKGGNDGDVVMVEDESAVTSSNKGSGSSSESTSTPSSISTISPNCQEMKETNETSALTSNNLQPQQTSQQQSQQQHQQQQQQQTPPKPTSQPSGWRVKLYLLNQDGSWDDCGTGRICLISKKTTGATATTNKKGVLSDTKKQHQQQQQSMQPSETQKEFLLKQQKIEEEIYHMLGEPTLFMHAEVQQPSADNLTNNNDGGKSTKKFQVLLRTRVLLRESYQRQGGNIITWCEPYFSKTGAGKITSSTSTNMGNNNHEQQQQQQNLQHVDLALSFQDNAGCLDIWNKISNIQVKAIDLFEMKNTASKPQIAAPATPLTCEIDGSDTSGESSSSTTATSFEQNEKSMSTTTTTNESSNKATNAFHTTSAATLEEEHVNALQNSNISVSPPLSEGQNNKKKNLNTSNWNAANNNQLRPSANNSQDGKNGVGIIKYDIDENGHHHLQQSKQEQDQHQKFIQAEATVVSMTPQFAGNGGDQSDHNQHQHHHHHQNEVAQHQQLDDQMMQSVDELDPNDNSNIAANAQLPNPPKLGNLEEIADVIAAAQVSVDMKHSK